MRMRRRKSSYKVRKASETPSRMCILHLQISGLQDEFLAMQVQKLQSGNVRSKEQHSLAEENMRSLHASEISAKEGDLRLLQQRYDDAVKQNEVQRTDSAAKVSSDLVYWRTVPHSVGYARYLCGLTSKVFGYKLYFRAAFGGFSGLLVCSSIASTCCGGLQQVKLYEQYRGWLHDAKQEHSQALEQEREVQETLKGDLERSHAHAHDLQIELESNKHVNGDLSRQVADLATRLDKRRAQEDSLKVALPTCLFCRFE